MKITDEAVEAMPERIYASSPSTGGCIVGSDVPSLAYDIECIRVDVAAAPYMSALKPSSAREQALEDDMRMGIIDLLHNLRFRLEAPGATIETDRKLVGQIIEMVDALKSQPAQAGGGDE